jgi:hypothetical protein
MAVLLVVKLKNPTQWKQKMARNKRGCQYELALNMLYWRTFQGVQKSVFGRMAPHKQNPA